MEHPFNSQLYKLQELLVYNMHHVQPTRDIERR